jgi:predicted nucleotidyltransferase
MQEMNHQALEDICQRFNVASLYVFGSRAREMADRLVGRVPASTLTDSDLDVAVQPVAGELRDASLRVDLMHELEHLFEVSRVDLVLLPEAGAFLVADAVRGELLYCDDEDRQAREELYYLRRAGDLAPFQRWRLEGILNGELRR